MGLRVVLYSIAKGVLHAFFGVSIGWRRFQSVDCKAV